MCIDYRGIKQGHQEKLLSNTIDFGRSECHLVDDKKLSKYMLKDCKSIGETKQHDIVFNVTISYTKYCLLWMKKSMNTMYTLS